MRRKPSNGDVAFSGRPFPPGPYPEVEGNVGGFEPFVPVGNRMCRGAPPGNQYAKGHGGPKICSSLRQEILAAAARSKWSSDKTLQSYLLWACETFPRDFFHVVGRLAPIEVRAAIATFDGGTTEDIREQLRAKGFPVDKLGPIFDQPRISKTILPPRPEPVDRTSEPVPEPDEDRLERESVDSNRHIDPPDVLVRTKTSPVRDVRNHTVTIMSPNGSWHELTDQMPLPLEETE
jgi:hypothetical protein